MTVAFFSSDISTTVKKHGQKPKTPSFFKSRNRDGTLRLVLTQSDTWIEKAGFRSATNPGFFIRFKNSIFNHNCSKRLWSSSHLFKHTVPPHSSSLNSIAGLTALLLLLLTAQHLEPASRTRSIFQRSYQTPLEQAQKPAKTTNSI